MIAEIEAFLLVRGTKKVDAIAAYLPDSTATSFLDLSANELRSLLNQLKGAKNAS
jgi:hypothetical protein